MKAKIGPSKVPGEKAGPNGSFPIGDAKHARLAISGATRSERAGNISASTAEHIKAKARAKLHGMGEDGGKRDGHTTSGLDHAMQQHADKVHPY